MALSRERKEELVAQYAGLLEQSKGLFLTDYSGIGVQRLEELRSQVHKAEGTYKVTKNSLLRLALQETGRPVPDELLQGQTATGFALGELSTLAKALVDFADEEENFLIKGGLMDGESLTVEQIEALADLPTLDELRSQIIGLINAPAQNVTSTVANGVRQIMNVLNAYSQQAEEAAEAAS